MGFFDMLFGGSDSNGDFLGNGGVDPYPSGEGSDPFGYHFRYGNGCIEFEDGTFYYYDGAVPDINYLCERHYEDLRGAAGEALGKDPEDVDENDFGELGWL